MNYSLIMTNLVIKIPPGEEISAVNQVPLIDRTLRIINMVFFFSSIAEVHPLLNSQHFLNLSPSEYSLRTLQWPAPPGTRKPCWCSSSQHTCTVSHIFPASCKLADTYTLSGTQVPSPCHLRLPPLTMALRGAS